MARRRRKILIIILFQFVLLIFYFKSQSESEKEPIDIGWYSNTSRNLSDYLKFDENTSIIEPVTVCYSNESILLIIAVASAPQNFERRNAIRKNWGNTSYFNHNFFNQAHGELSGKYFKINKDEWKEYVEMRDDESSDEPLTKFRVKVVFFIGKVNDIDEENEITQQNINYEDDVFNDIVQEDFIDSYYNLTLKSVFMLKWFTRRCQNKAKFLLKTDDDAFINIPNLIQVLLGGTIPMYKSAVYAYNSKYPLNEKNRMIKNENLLMGTYFKFGNVIRQKSHRYYTPEFMFTGKEFPPYLEGFAYVMSNDVVHKLYHESFKTPIFHFEDIFLTSFVAKKLRIPLIHHPAMRLVYDKLNLCSLHGVMAQHKVNAEEMDKAFKFLTENVNECPRYDKSSMWLRLSSMLNGQFRGDK